MPTIGALCMGYGGLDLAVEYFYQARTIWASEKDSAAAAVIDARFQIPNLGDLTRVDWASVQPVDIVTAGWPCQPYSQAGRRNTQDDPRAIWPHIEQAIGQLRPSIVVLENVPGICRPDAAGRVELARVTRDLANHGFDIRWRLTRASEAGAPHRRRRIFILATHPDRPRLEGQSTLPRPHQFDSGTHGVDAAGWVAPPSWGCPACGGLDPDCAICNIDLRVGHGWGATYPAIEQWATTIGWWPPAARTDQLWLTPRFAEWMQGLEPGWITDVPGLNREQQIRIAGNGVNPWQAVTALQHLVKQPIL